MYRIRAWLTIVLSVVICMPVHAVVIGSRDWREVTDTVNFTYNNLASVCDVVTGACSGPATNHVGTTVDLSGWVWASAADMASLFGLITAAPPNTFDPLQIGFSQPKSYTWASDFIDHDGAGPDTGLFAATHSFSAVDHVVFGLTRTLVADGTADRSYIRDSDVNNLAVVGNPVGVDIARSHTGMWLFREVAVPSPGSIGILLAGLFCLMLRRILHNAKPESLLA